jgi:S-adenosylmethionine:tRNA ribosyltransferase-isomerase
MNAATWPRHDPSATRLLHIDPSSRLFADRSVGDLRELLRPGDLLVVNDAATLPSSLRGTTVSGETVEVRLAGETDDGAWRAVLFGAGDWRTRTEDRPAPPRLGLGDRIQFEALAATVVGVDRESPRLVTIAFDASGPALWTALYRAGRPVQYAYTAAPLAIWHVQTAYAARPWAVEAPSAGFALTWDLLLELRRRGVGIARITHAAGLSSTGDRALDARLPLAERYDVSAETVRAVEQTKAMGGRVIAAGTTVARALESAAAADGRRLVAGRGTTDLRLGPSSRPRVVDGIVTGVHDAETSHFALLEAFAPRELLDAAHMFAEARGYLGHEFGDIVLVLAAGTEAAAPHDVPA